MSSPDVFISYPHLSNKDNNSGQNGWVARLHKDLQIELDDLLGREAVVWRDNKMRFGTVLADAISEQLRQTKVLLCVLSPAYLKSSWCRRELEEFRCLAEQSGGLKVREQSRIIPVVKTPIDQDALGFGETIFCEFFDTEGVGNAPQTFSPDENGYKHQIYKQKVREIAWSITHVLNAFPDNNQADLARTIYLAETSNDIILFRAPNYKDPALPYFDNALKTARSQNVKFKPSIFVDIGDRLTESFPPDKAIAAVRFYDYASEVIPNENPELKAEVLIKAADLLARSSQTDDLNNSVARYSKAGELLASTDPKQTTINLRIGDALLSSHQIQEAREAYQKAAELARAAKEPADYGEALRRIGDTYVSAEKDNARALEAYNRALAAYAVQDPTSSGVNLVFGDARVREAIGLVNEQSGNKTQAASFYRQAKELYGELLKRSSKDFDEFPSLRVEISSRLDGVTNSINRLQVSPP